MSPLLHVLFLSLLIGSTFAKKKTSDSFILCKRSDPEFATCVKNTLIEATPRFVKGMPEVNLPPVDPMFIPKISLNQGQKNFKLSLALINLTVTGLKDVKIHSLTIDNEFTKMNMSSTVKSLHLEGDYTMDGQILVIPVKGNGHCTFDFDDIIFHAHITFEEYEKKGEKYVRVKNFTWDLNPGKGRSYFTNLFNGDKTLGDNANKFFNENWKETFYTYKQLPEQAFGEFFKEYANRPLDLHPAKEWFVDGY